MLKIFFGSFLLIAITEGTCLKPIVVNPGRNFIIKNEGVVYKSSSRVGREDVIKSDLVINEDPSSLMRSGYSFPMGDTVVIELFETTESYHNIFDIMILKDQYLIQYRREINDTEFVQKFAPVKSKLELSSSDISNGSKIRGRVEYTGRCVSGCSDKNSRIRIEGNFAVKINQY
jgi:hypothetical protein